MGVLINHYRVWCYALLIYLIRASGHQNFGSSNPTACYPVAAHASSAHADSLKL